MVEPARDHGEHQSRRRGEERDIGQSPQHGGELASWTLRQYLKRTWLCIVSIPRLWYALCTEHGAARLPMTYLPTT